MSTRAGPTLGDIAATPHYCTSYQNAHGYQPNALAYDTQRSRRDRGPLRAEIQQRVDALWCVSLLCLLLLSAKAAHWESSYQWHAPSAEILRQRFLTKAGRDEARRTQPQNAQVAELLQARTALLGSTCDLSTSNSLRVAARYGEASGPRTDSAYPVPFSASQELSPHDAWASRTIPRERVSSQRMNGAASKLAAPSYADRAVRAGGSTALRMTRATEAANSRQTNAWDSEYCASYCDAQNAAQLPTAQPDFLSTSLRAFEDPTATDLGASQLRVHKIDRPQTPTQPLQERVVNERVSSIGLASMRRPVHRKEFSDLDDSFTATSRPQGTPYSFDMRDHIERMRPSPLPKDVARGGRPQREALQQSPMTITQVAALSQTMRWADSR